MIQCIFGTCYSLLSKDVLHFADIKDRLSCFIFMLNIRNSNIHDSQKVELIQLSINRWWMLNEILFSLKKGILTHTTSQTTFRCCAKWSKLITRGQIFWFYSHEVPLIVKLIETESRGVVARDQVGVELVYKGAGASVLQNDKVLEVNGGDGCKTMWMYLMPLNWTLKSS